MAQGSVYIITHTTFQPNILKVGKTTRTPEERVKELEKATGVPKGYTVAHEQFFDDCDKAELDIHELLKPYLHSKEFFQVDLGIAIKLLDSLKIKELEEKIKELERESEKTKKIIEQQPSQEYVEMLRRNLICREINQEYASKVWHSLPQSLKHHNVKDTSEQIKEQIKEYTDSLDIDEKKQLFYEILQDDNAYIPYLSIEELSFKRFEEDISKFLEYLVDGSFEWYDKIIDDERIVKYEENIGNDFFNAKKLRIHNIEDGFDLFKYLQYFPFLEYIEFSGYSSNVSGKLEEIINKTKLLPHKIKIIIFKLTDTFQTDLELDKTIQKLYETLDKVDILAKSNSNGSLFDIGKYIEITKFLLFD